MSRFGSDINRAIKFEIVLKCSIKTNTHSEALFINRLSQIELVLYSKAVCRDFFNKKTVLT